ncbi:hypothetical protein SDC9_50730 [bioreactor metagenome]|uniref:Uncharacterized protein n=1 Tax=bioreactor metagenome TaxID=1076179 RepID=A0A644WQ77_9ZZZZ
MHCVMNKNKTTYAEIWRAWIKYCHEPKTIFDFKDRAKALLLLGILAFIIYLLVQVIFTCYNIKINLGT